MKHSLFGGGALAGALLSVSMFFYAAPSFAETSTLHSSQQLRVAEQPEGTHAAQENSETNNVAASASNEADASATSDSKDETGNSVSSQAESYTATAYCLRGRMASGSHVRKGAIAADSRVLPLGTRVRIDAGNYSGEYTVLDTGGTVRGRKIDVWVPSAGEAMQFGRRKVRLTVLQYGGSARAAAHRR